MNCPLAVKEVSQVDSLQKHWSRQLRNNGIGMEKTHLECTASVHKDRNKCSTVCRLHILPCPKCPEDPAFVAGFADDLTFAGDKSRWSQELQLSNAFLFWFLFTVGAPLRWMVSYGGRSLLCLATASGATREI